MFYASYDTHIVLRQKTHTPTHTPTYCPKTMLTHPEQSIIDIHHFLITAGRENSFFTTHTHACESE